MRLAPNYSTDEKFTILALYLWNFVNMTSSWVGNIAWILSYLEWNYGFYVFGIFFSQSRTCSWWAALTLTKWNKVGRALFWNSLPIWRQNLAEKNFHHWTSKLLAIIHGCWSSPSRHDWPCMPAGSFEVQWWNIFLMLILSSHG